MSDTPIDDYTKPEVLNLPFANININEGPHGRELIFVHKGRWYRQGKVPADIILQGEQIFALQSQLFKLDEIEEISDDYPLGEME